MPPAEPGTGTAGGGGALVSAVLRAATGSGTGLAEQVGAFGALLK
jgi:hypothetical protein